MTVTVDSKSIHTVALNIPLISETGIRFLYTVFSLVENVAGSFLSSHIIWKSGSLNFIHILVDRNNLLRGRFGKFLYSGFWMFQCNGAGLGETVSEDIGFSSAALSLRSPLMRESYKLNTVFAEETGL